MRALFYLLSCLFTLMWFSGFYVLNMGPVMNVFPVMALISLVLGVAQMFKVKLSNEGFAV